MFDDNVTVKLFADNLKLYCIYGQGGQNNLKESLLALEKWSNNSQLDIAPHKCFALYLGHDNPKTEYELNSIKIKKTQTCCDLGVNVSDDLTFSNHCLSVTSKTLWDINIIQMFSY